MTGDDSVEADFKRPANTNTNQNIGETKASVVAKKIGTDSTNMISSSDEVNVSAEDAHCSTASKSSSPNQSPGNPDEKEITKIHPASLKKLPILKRPSTSSGAAAVAKTSSAKSKLGEKKELTQEEIELEQRREASRISSRRSQERQKRRIEYLAKEETRLQDANAKQREENDSLRNMIQHVKRKIRTAQTMQDSAIPRLDQQQAAGLANRGVSSFLQSHHEHYLSGLADHGTASATGFSQHHGIPPTRNSSIANTTGLLDTTSLLSRQNLGRSAALGMLGGPFDQHGGSNLPTAHGGLSNAFLPGPSSIPAWSPLDSDPSLSSQFPSTARGDHLAAAGIVIPNPIQQELLAIEEAIRQSRASLAASATRPAGTADSLENLRSYVGGTSGFASNNELLRTPALGELHGGSVHDGNVAHGTRQHPLSSSTEGNQLDSFLASSQPQQQQPAQLFSMTDAARRNQMDLRLLLRGRELTSYHPTAEESLGLLSSNNLDTAHRELRPGMDVNSALELQRGLATNPAIVASSSLYPPERSSLHLPQTSGTLSPLGTSGHAATQNKKKANGTKHET